MEQQLECAPPRPPETELAAGTSGVIEVRRAPTGHLLVRPIVDGRDLGWFILDTGGGPGVIASAAVERLGWSPIGGGLATSASGTVPASWHKAQVVELGLVRMHDVPLIELDLDYLAEPLGTAVSGIIGYGFFARVVVEVGSTEGTLTVLTPDDPRVASAPWAPLTLVDLVPVVNASFFGGTGRFRLDLGAGGGAGGVVFHSPAVARLGLDSLLAPQASAVTPQAVVTTLDWLELGGRRIPDVPALLWRSKEGALADPHLTGNIGLTVLGQFSFLLDYSRERFALIPR
jgi:predicted aspartyl protease